MCQDISVLTELLDVVDAIEQILVKIDEDYFIVKGYWKGHKIVLEHSAGYIDINNILMFNVLK